MKKIVNIILLVCCFLAIGIIRSNYMQVLFRRMTDRDFQYESDRYYNFKYRLSMKLPTGWRAKSKNKSLFIGNPHKEPPDLIGIALFDFNEPDKGLEKDNEEEWTLENFYSVAPKAYLSKANEVLDESQEHISHILVKRVIYTVTEKSGRERKDLVYFLANDERGYIMTCLSTPEHFVSQQIIYDEIVQSFKFE